MLQSIADRGRALISRERREPAHEQSAGIVATACAFLGVNTAKDILISGYDNLWNDSPFRPFSKGTPAVTVEVFVNI